MSPPEHPRLRLLAALGTAPGQPLHIDGIAADELATRFGTPLYAYAASVLRARLREVRAAFGPRVEVLYAVKANPAPAVVRTLGAAGAGAELASAGEVAVAAAAGIAGERMQIAGPAKSDHDLRAALRAGVGAVNLESEREYERLVAAAERLQLPARVALRVNPAREVGGSRMRMGGGSKKFGIDAGAVPALARRIVDEGRAQLIGLHQYLGTQAFDADAWLAAADDLLALADRVEDACHRPLASLGLGGGFGVAVHAGDPAFDLARCGAGVQDRIERSGRTDRRHSIELGRYLTADAGVYLTRVVEHKLSAGRRFVLCDGGMHHHAAAAGFGTVIKRPWPAAAAADPHARGTEPQVLCGPLCTPADELAPDDTLPPLREGDLVALLASGAYGLTFSNVLFLSHPLPAEILVDAGTVTEGAWHVRTT